MAMTDAQVAELNALDRAYDMGRPTHYDYDGEPIRLGDWARLFEDSDRRVGLTRLDGRDVLEGVSISTVYLGLDHRWGDGPPLIYETMIFGGPLSDECWRCTTWEQALAQHDEAVRLARLEKSVGGVPASIVADWKWAHP